MRSVVVSTLALMAPVAASAAALQFTGKGSQIYVCNAVESGFAWRLKAPDAVLVDATGQDAGKHFAGPSWQAPDGSTIVGEVVTASPAPVPGSIPWLVLRVKSHEGTGVFASVTYVARTQTEGGVAPQDGCDSAHTDAEIRVPYTATYILFAP